MEDHNDSKVPTIRFKGFEGEWAEKMLGDVCAIGDADHWMPETVSHGIPYVMTGDFCGINEIAFKNAKLISSVDYEKLSRKIKPEFGDILFARYASIGSVRYVNTTRKFIASYSCAILKSNSSFNSEYLFYLIKTDKTQNKLKQSINTGSQGNIGIESLKNLGTLFPEKTEQAETAKFFSRVDEMLRLHQRKHDKLVTLKKAMLQQMLPQAGATNPEIRFKGFEGEWEEKKLGDIGLFYRGISYNATNVCRSGLLVLRSSNIQSSKLILDSDLQFIDKECPEEIMLRKGDIALCMSNGSKALVGKSALCESNPVSPTTVGAFCSIYRSGNAISPYLLQTVTYSKYLYELLAGSSINNLKNSDLRNLIFRIPIDKTEQKKIGTYFRQLDQLISKHAIQLQKLKQIKSACLEKMFV